MNLDFNFAPSQEQYKSPALISDPIEAFQNKLAEYGLISEYIIADGTLQRFNVDNRNMLLFVNIFYLITIDPPIT